VFVLSFHPNCIQALGFNSAIVPAYFYARLVRKGWKRCLSKSSVAKAKVLSSRLFRQNFIKRVSLDRVVDEIYVASNKKKKALIQDYVWLIYFSSSGIDRPSVGASPSRDVRPVSTPAPRNEISKRELLSIPLRN
jgi:hypothetical protein